MAKGKDMNRISHPIRAHANIMQRVIVWDIVLKLDKVDNFYNIRIITAA